MAGVKSQPRNGLAPKVGYPEARGQVCQLTSEQFAANQVVHYIAKLGAPGHCGGANWIFSDSTSGVELRGRE